MSLLVSQHNIKEHVAVKVPFIYGTGMTKSLFLTLTAPSQGEFLARHRTTHFCSGNTMFCCPTETTLKDFL